MGTFVKWLDKINKDMFQECGGKAAHLGELTSMGLNIPKGFCLVAKAFLAHLESNNLDMQILNIAESINYDDFYELEQKTGKIRSLIEAAEMPLEVKKEITENYQRLSKEETEPFVAIRSSVAVMGTLLSSFPGMMDTYHYIRGRKEVVESVRKCFASIWSGRAAFARHKQRINHTNAIIAPIVQLMVNSEMAGVAFTANPISGEEGEIVIEANWGLGESVVSGKAVNDLYIVNKKPYKVKQMKIARKETSFIKSEGSGGEWVDVEREKVNKPTLTYAQVEELYRTALSIEEHYGYPQDIEWAYDEKGVLYILQTRRAKIGGN
jgi:pyruvate,water dikinase